MKVRNDMLFNNIQIDPGLILHRSSGSFIRVLSNNEEIRDEDSKATTARVGLPPVYESSLHAVRMTWKWLGKRGSLCYHRDFRICIGSV